MRLMLLLPILLSLLACSAHADGPDGLYLMTRFAFGSLEMKVFHFADGVVVRNPTGGADGVDAERERALRPADVGAFRFASGKLAMDLDGRSNESAFEPNGGCFGWDGGIFCPAVPFEADTRLDAVYEGGASVGGGAAMSSTTIRFQPDGRYVMGNVGSVSTQGAGSAATASSQGQEHGRYEIGGTALTLTPDGGSARRYSTFPYDDGSEGPPPRRLYFGGGMLERRD